MTTQNKCGRWLVDDGYLKLNISVEY